MEDQNSQKIDNIAIEQNKMAALNEMISMLAHQWRQPLSAIGANVAKIELDVSLGSVDENELLTSVTSMKKSLEYLSKTIDDFRNFFTPSQSKSFISTKKLIERAEDIISIALAQNRVMFIIEEPFCEVELELYVNEVVQVLVNLLQNALDEINSRTKKGGCIWVECILLDEWIQLEIKDNAGGIDEDIMEKIFQPYFSTKKKKNGGGLGLYMARSVIEQHCDGVLEVSNSEIGAIFTIKLPIKREK